MNFTLIQTDLVWENKEKNLTHLESKLEDKLIKPKSIVILPEMFSTGFSMKPEKLAEKINGPTIGWMKKISREKNIILTGSLIIRENDQFYNRLIWMQPDGNFACYNKAHLFAYAEEDKHYQAGNRRVIVSVNEWKILLLICYDLRFPVWARQQITKDPEFDAIIYVANWPESRIENWKTLLQARAIENQCYTIGVNRVGKDGHDILHNGKSMITGPDGKIIYEAPDYQEIIHPIELDKKKLELFRQKNPFLNDINKFKIIA